MSELKPLVYIFHGDDLDAIERAVKQVSQSLFPKDADPMMVQMNTSKLDGRTASVNDLTTAVGSMPFLAEHRLVILSHPLTRLMKDENEAAMTNLLNGMPPFCTLLLMIEDSYDSKKKDWEHLKMKHWLRTWAKNATGKVQVQTLTLPKQAEMPKRIIERTKELGGEINPNAAQILADQVGNDTGIATQEIIKLLTYIDPRQTIEVEDVRMLTPYGVQTDVFKLVDMMSSGNAAGAIRSLHALLEREEVRFLFGMVMRQFRLLIQTRDLLDRGVSQDTLQKELKLPDFVVNSLVGQANRFTMENLKAFYRQLYRLEKEVKNFRMDYDMALDIFIASLKR